MAFKLVWFGKLAIIEFSHKQNTFPNVNYTVSIRIVNISLTSSGVVFMMIHM